jgi:drug/metabolite transporter (DMT)-like permease
VAKPALAEVPPVSVALARAVIAALVLGALSIAGSGGLAAGVRHLAGEGRRRWRLVALYGVISFCGTSLIAMSAQQLLPASINGVLNNLAPLWIALYAALTGRARNAVLLVAGSALAAAGVAGVLLARGGAGDAATLAGPAAALGVLLSLSGSLLIAVAQVLTRRLMPGRDPLALTAVGAAWGALPLLALALAGAGGDLQAFVAASAATRWRLLWLGTMSTAFNFALWSFALAHLPVTRIVPLQYLIAPMGVGLAVLLLGEPVGPELLAGTVAILAGIALAQRGAKRA